ncbi:MAG: hypothetical protein GEU80_02215 [Dehalococcoidia bacterium]|nr:hypothetical protein [Dehalococcoidia bacterium]
MRRTYPRREVLRLGAAALGAGLLAACGAARSEDDADNVVPIHARSKPEAPVRGARVNLGVVDPQGAAVPRLLRGEELLAYARLVAVDPRTALIHADLATEIEAPDPLRIRLKLHPDARFHVDASGAERPVTAEDVRLDFARRADEGVALFDQVIEAVEAPDEQTLVLRLRGPFGLLFELLGSVDASVRGPVNYPTFDNPMGGGPFIPEHADGRRDRFVANPSYHNADYPLLAEVEVARFPTAHEMATAFTAGNLHAAYDPAPISGATPDEEAPEHSVGRASQRLVGLGLSLLPTKGGASVRHLEAFQDERVRRAVSVALDREAIRGADSSFITGPVTPAHRADALPRDELVQHPIYQHDPAQVRALLEASGHAGLNVRLQVPDLARMRPLGQQVVDQLAAAGFGAQLVLEAPGDWDRAFLAGDFEAALFEIGGLTTPDVGLRLHTSGGVDGRFSPWGYSNPVYDAAVRDTLSRLDPALRARRSREAQRILFHDIPAMFPLAAPMERASVAPDLASYAFDAYDFNDGWLAAGWQVGRVG